MTPKPQNYYANVQSFFRFRQQSYEKRQEENRQTMTGRGWFDGLFDGKTVKKRGLARRFFLGVVGVPDYAATALPAM